MNKNLCLEEQQQQIRAGVRCEALEVNLTVLKSRLQSALRKKLNTADVTIVKTFGHPDNHCVFYYHNQLGQKIFCRAAFVIGDDPLITIGDIEAVNDDEEDKIRSAMMRGEAINPTGMTIKGHSFTEARQQQLAGMAGNIHSLNEDTPGRVELRECLFDSGAIKIVEKEVLLESGKVAKPMLIMGKAAKVGVTANNRFYSKKLWQTVIPKAMEKIKKSTLLGQVDHPMPEGSSGQLSQIGVKFIQLDLDDNYLTYKAEILDTPSGKTLKQLLAGGVRVGVSTRGFGQSKEGKIDGQECKIIDEADYDLAAIDFVLDPAVAEAGIDHFKS